MLFWGFVVGIGSAILQSSAYIFSRRFAVKQKSAGKLTAYSQLWMLLMGLLTLLVISPWQRVVFTRELIVLMIIFSVFGNLAYFCFFRAQEEIESSRISSLLGLKMISLAFFNMLLLKYFPDLLKLCGVDNALSTADIRQFSPGIYQWAAIIISSFAAVGMNFSGGRLPWKGCVFLTMTLLCYAVTDNVAAMMVKAIHGDTPLMLRSVAASSLAFMSLGFLSNFTFLKDGFDFKCMKNAFGYGALWFAAMIGFLATLNMLGVMYANIVQVSRGFFSVVIGFILLKTGIDKLEPEVSGKMWLRRVIMAVLMIVAMALYVRK